MIRRAALLSALTPLLLVAWTTPAGRAQLVPPAGEEPAPPPPPISADLEPTRDRAIERRIEAIYAELEELAGVEVEVEAGVVRLSGETLSAQARQRAEGLAASVEGVVAVANEITAVRDLERRLHPAWEKLRGRALDVAAALPLLGIALAVFFLFWLLARWLGRRQRLFARLSPNAFIQELLRQIARAALLVAGALVALELLDATALVGAVLGTAGLVGLALGFAFRDTAENYIASVLLSLRQPFAPNDHVVIEGHEGKVVRLTSRATVLLTLDGNHVRIPNATVFKGILINYTKNPERRFSFTVGVGVEEDLAAVQRLGLETLRRMDGVLATSEPAALLEELGDSNVVLRFFGWVDQTQADFGKVKSEAMRRVKEAFDAAGVAMPEPIYRLRTEEIPRPAESPAAVAPERAAPPAAAVDLSPETHIDRQVAEERVSEGDLLDPQAPRE